MMAVGLTGGIASGKSQASQFFADLGIAVISADKITKDLMSPNHPHILQQITEYFGDAALTQEGLINRPYLRQQIFSHTHKRHWLENLLHPLVKRQIQHFFAADGPYGIAEVPLLFETGMDRDMQYSVLIDCSEAQQIERLNKRDSANTEQAKAILAAQMPRTERLQRADYVIVNDGALEALQQSTLELHHKLLNQSKIHHNRAS